MDDTENLIKNIKENLSEQEIWELIPKLLPNAKVKVYSDFCNDKEAWYVESTISVRSF